MTLLIIRELEKKYIDENITQSIYDIIKDYNIIKNLRYFIINNISNNDFILKELNLLIIQDEDIGFDSVERRFRCFGYIINLIIKDLLYESKKKKDKYRNNEIDDNQLNINDKILRYDNLNNDQKRKKILRKT